MTSLSVKQFKKLIWEEMEVVAEENGWDLNVEVHRGYAFQLWCANTICAYDQGIETDPMSSLLYSHDLKADIVLEDSVRKHLVIAQCKFSTMHKKAKSIEESEVNDFFNRHEAYLDRDWVKKNGSEGAFDKLGDYAEKINDGYHIDYYFLSTAKKSERLDELVTLLREKIDENALPINLRLYDFNDLKDYYVRSKSLQESIPDEVTLQLRKGGWFEKPEPYKTIIAVVKGNSLRALYGQYREALVAFNIRSYLGDRGINKKITETAEEDPQNFFYFNNGISAICTDFEIRGNTLYATKLQVINGAQTIGALRRADDNDNLDVLMRITKTTSVATEKGINAEIIKYNNSQNVIKVSDFRSNDPIQLWLERRVADLKVGSGPLPKLVYVRKRGLKKGGRGTGRGLKLEDAGKIRYAFNYEPTRILATPGDLWAYASSGGLYEKAYGVEEKIEDIWGDEEFNSFLLATAFYFKIESTLKEVAKKEKKLSSIARLKFHGLSLAGVYMRLQKDKLDIMTIISSNREFNRVWKDFWRDANRLIIDAYYDAVNTDLVTIWAMSRNERSWKQMRDKLEAYQLGDF
ncbi:AIPR family protein [Pseudomonadota bacterium]